MVLAGDALVDRPLHGVKQIVVHRTGPLKVAGVDEVLAEPGGAAIVNAQHGIAAVGQPLVPRIVAPVIARPRPAVDEQDHRQRLVRFPVLVRVGPNRKGAVADKVEAVT